MKRLIKRKIIKTCEFHNSIKDIYTDRIIDCYMNPTSSEWDKIVKQSPCGGVRCLAMPDGKVYAWSSEIPHYRAIEKFNLPDGREHIDGNKNEITHLCAQSYTTPQSLQDAFKNSDSLYNYFSQSTKLEVSTYCKDAPNFPEYEEFKTIADIVNAKILVLT